MATTISDLIQDDQNLNSGTARGQELLEKSIEQVGFGRSIVTDRDGKILAGNKTHLAAMKTGKQKVIVVESEGDALIVHKRTDLAAGTAKATKLAILDNRTNQLNLHWVDDVRERVEQADIAIEEVGWTEQELAVPQAEEGQVDRQPSAIGESYAVVVDCADEADQQRVYDRLVGLGFKCRVLTL